MTVTWVWVWEQQIYILFTATPGFKGGKLLIPPLNQHSAFDIIMTGAMKRAQENKSYLSSVWLSTLTKMEEVEMVPMEEPS